MLINAKRMIGMIIVAVMLSACSTKAVINNANDKVVPTGKTNSIFTTGPSDKESFEEVLSYLSNHEKEPNYNEARIKLDNFLTQFPGSKWSATARVLCSDIDRIVTLQKHLRQEKQKNQSENLRMTREIEGLKDKGRQIEEKYSAEITKLQQENEQLKKDIQQLKNLEIQLEKREKMLR